MKALIFDVDGTLAETEELHRQAFNAAFAAFGMTWRWSPELYRRLLTTTGGKERIARFAAETGMAEVPIAALHAEKTRRFTAALASGIAPRPGIARLMTEARAAGLRLAVATTTTPANVEALALAAFGRPATALFDAIAAGDMVATKKPAPDIYTLALRMLGLGPAEVVAFEDSANGVRAAARAGLPVILSRGFYTAQEPDAGATLALGCFSELGGLQGLRARLQGVRV